VGSIAIGFKAGTLTQGVNSIAIGYLAASTNQTANSICINATGSILNTVNAGFYVAPIRTIAGGSGVNVLCYNTASREIYLNSSKTFVINHPLDNDKYLVHACLEGPETGVYYRGKGEIINNKYVIVYLPSYVDSLAKEFTVQITPIYNGKLCKQLHTSEVNNNCFTVYGENSKFYWLVHGKISDIQTEPFKENVNVKGYGPYKWI